MSAPRRSTLGRALGACLAVGVLACSPGGEAEPDEAAEPSPPVTMPAPTQATPDRGAVATSEPTLADGQAAAAWRGGTPAPRGLTEVAAAPFAGSVWTAGGLDAQGRAVPAVQVYDPTFDAWSDGPPLPAAVHHAALVAAGDRLYLLGGYAGNGFDTPSAQVWMLQAATGVWEPGPVLPEARAAGAAAWDGQRLVYGGGVGSTGLSGDVWALMGDVWQPLGALTQAREHLAAASDGAGHVWLLGGRTGGLDSNLGAVDVVVGDEITAAGALPTPRGGVAGFYGGPAVGACAVGGEHPDGTYAAVECVDATGQTTTLAPLSVPRHGLGAVVLDGVAITLLGGPEPGLSVSSAVEMLTMPATAV